MTDLFLLAQCGQVGRTEANEILWSLMTNQALDPEYKDLSNYVSNAVHRHRKYFERPPDTHYDRGTWHWGRLTTIRNVAYDPQSVPRKCCIRSGPGGIPLPPPKCWQCK